MEEIESPINSRRSDKWHFLWFLDIANDNDFFSYRKSKQNIWKKVLI